MNKYNDAINICLSVIGEQVIEGTLSIDGIYEAEQADILIEATKEEILSEGWTFNTDTKWPLLPDTSGYITVPAGVLRVDPSEESNKYIRKDGKLYNKEAFTYNFTDAVECDIVLDLDFDDLPVIMQQYIVLKASRILYQRLVGDKTMLGALIQDEREALLKVKTHEDDVQDYNIFDNSTVARVIRRNTNPTGVKG